MSETLTKVIVDCSTGVSEILPLNAEEIEQYEKDLADFAAQKAEQDAIVLAKAEAKASAEAKLSALGLTPEEISALR
jgi:hypothetical protein